MKHPTFNGNPILIGDLIRVSDGHPENTSDWVPVDTIRIVRDRDGSNERLWIHADDGASYSEVIFPTEADAFGSGRWVCDHKPNQEEA